MKTHDPDLIYKFILRFKERNDGISPTIREIMEECEISSTSTTAYILKKLEKQQKIYIMQDLSRGIKVIGSQWMPPGRP